MSYVSVKKIPNILTTLRLILAVPVCLLILNEKYSAVLWLALIAAFSDVLDGYLARKLDALSHYGAAVDPLADKTLVLCTYFAFAVVGLLPWWVVAILLVRDILILGGALIYRMKIGRYKIAPSIWGKVSTAMQLGFSLLLLMQQVYPVLPQSSLSFALWLMILMTFISGSHYLYTWGGKIAATKKS